MSDVLLVSDSNASTPKRIDDSWEQQRIPQEDTHAERLPTGSCEPVMFSVDELAQLVYPRLSESLQQELNAIGQTRQKPGWSQLSFFLGGTFERGGLNSRDQRTSSVRVWNQDKQKYISRRVADWDHIWRSEAFRYRFVATEGTLGSRIDSDTKLSAHEKHVVRQVMNSLLAAAPGGGSRNLIESIYFPSFPLEGAARRATRGNVFTPCLVLKISDGDTITVEVRPSGCKSYVNAIRFAGIDTPEKFRSTKFYAQMDGIIDKWRREGLVSKREMMVIAANEERRAQLRAIKKSTRSVKRTPLEQLLANRMEYAGAVSSLVMKDLLAWAMAKKCGFALEETYNRVLKPGQDPIACDMVTLYGNYMRDIAVVRLLKPELIEQYMRERLPVLMRDGGNFSWLKASQADVNGNKAEPTNGRELWANYQLSTLSKAEKDYLKKLRKGGRHKLADLLDPAKFPAPWEMFSPKKTRKMVEGYAALLDKHPDRRGDLNLAMIAMGGSYAYAKYRNDHTDTYLAASAFVEKHKLGIWGEETVRLLDVNKWIVRNGKLEPFTPPKDCLTS